MVVLVELPVRVAIEIATASDAGDDLPAPEPADELTPAAKVSGAVTLPLLLAANQVQPVAPTWLDR
jgi:hypothetical protein